MKKKDAVAKLQNSYLYAFVSYHSNQTGKTGGEILIHTVEGTWCALSMKPSGHPDL